MNNTIIQLITGILIVLAVIGLGLVQHYLASKQLAARGVDAEKLKKKLGKKRQNYLDRVLDILFFLLIVFLAQALIQRFGSAACPLSESYARMIMFGGLALIPFGLGYIWSMLPRGLQGTVEAVLFQAGKLTEETRAAKLHRTLWRPWTGVVFILFYLWGAACVYMGLTL